ncbi:MAG: hypothetical protein E5299_00853 [Burkholderia gladioli]|nr:MAG: hypothetical protein E5299_00853 [Burkholderia gladioli]
MLAISRYATSSSSLRLTSKLTAVLLVFSGETSAGESIVINALARRCCINRARSIDVYAQRSRGQPPIKSDSRVTA